MEYTSMTKLIEASDILLDEKDYDGHEYELIAWEWVDQQNDQAQLRTK